MKALETRYAGCRFRSRLEARWAVFFDHLGIKWDYEAEGFETSAGPYLPDFKIRVPQIKNYDHYQWFEVKPPGEPEDPRHLALARESAVPLIVARGLPRDYLDQDHGTLQIHLPMDQYHAALSAGRSLHPASVMFVDSTSRAARMYCSLGDNRHWCMEDMNNTLRGSATCHLAVACYEGDSAPTRGANIDRALTAARSARFGT
jgi:hypothetical protein